MAMKATRCVDGKIVNSDAIRQYGRAAQKTGKAIEVFANKLAYLKSKEAK